MDAAVVAALVAASAGLLVSIANGRAGLRNAQAQGMLQRELELLRSDHERRRAMEERAARTEEVIARYREPLAGAAFDLQSRLFNILDRGFLENHANAGSELRDAAVRTTLFRFAQYFGWTEILREEVQFLKLPEEEATRHVSALLADVGRVLNTNLLEGRAFMFWRDEQRAIGELMIDREARIPRCFGYARFAERYDQTFAPWFHPHEQALVPGVASGSERLQLAQHALRALVEVLDEGSVRYSPSDLEPAQRPLGHERARSRRQEIV